MILTLLSINMSLTMVFITMKHPLSMGGILLMQTVTISMMSGLITQNMWFSYILFLIMIGGMLILFMYMTSIASNEKFKINIKIIALIPLTMTMMLMMENYKLSITSNEMMEQTKTTEFTFILNKFMNLPLTMLFIFMMIYLLLAMIATVKISSFKQGSIRQMN